VYFYFDLVADQAILLKASSKARFSLSYWNEVISDPHNVTNQKAGSFQILTTALTDEQKFLITCVSDIIGCVKGGLLGGVTSSAATAVALWWDEVTDFFEDAWNLIF